MILTTSLHGCDILTLTPEDLEKLKEGKILRCGALIIHSAEDVKVEGKKETSMDCHGGP